MLYLLSIIHHVEKQGAPSRDTWPDTRNRTLINFLVSSTKGTMFLKSVDASDKIKSAQMLYHLMEEVVHKVGEHVI
jgi:hypothetical protein